MKLFFRSNIFFSLFVALGLIGLILFVPRLDSNTKSCRTTTQDREVRHSSLSGLIEEGETVKIAFGFYDCHEILRGDIVAYQYAGNTNPIIKIVYGIPGDRFALKKSNTGWLIILNGRPLINAQGTLYVLPDEAYRVLSLYERDYRGVIPLDAFLILGNLPTGSLDSSKFGLVDKGDIIGKVIR